MPRKIRTAAVIGSGVMGGGITALLAAAGVKTLLLDIVPFDLSTDDKNDPAIRDDDGDGHQGVTVIVKVAGYKLGELYIIRREIYENYLTLMPDGGFYGYLEDRRPGANSDPYLVAAHLCATICDCHELVSSDGRAA